MIRYACIAAVAALAFGAPSAGNDTTPLYDYRERLHALAFDPAKFFPELSAPAMAVRYSGDDYGFPVYAIAVRKDCVPASEYEKRRRCRDRLIARMVRSPEGDKSSRLRQRGQRLVAKIEQAAPKSDDALLMLLDNAQLEWLEANLDECPSGMAHLATGRDLKFSPALDQADQAYEIILHADKVSFEIGDYLSRSRYQGWLKPGSPGEWANNFAVSLEPCWRPAQATVPWRVTR